MSKGLERKCAPEIIGIEKKPQDSSGTANGTSQTVFLQEKTISTRKSLVNAVFLIEKLNWNSVRFFPLLEIA